MSGNIFDYDLIDVYAVDSDAFTYFKEFPISYIRKYKRFDIATTHLGGDLTAYSSFSTFDIVNDTTLKKNIDYAMGQAWYGAGTGSNKNESIAIIKIFGRKL